MRFLLLILLLSLPCTISIKAMEKEALSYSKTTEAYNKKTSLLEAITQDKLSLSATKDNKDIKILFSDFSNQEITYQLTSLELEKEMLEEIPYFSSYLECKAEIRHNNLISASLEEKMKHFNNYLSNNSLVKTIYQFAIDRYIKWAKNKEIITGETAQLETLFITIRSLKTEEEIEHNLVPLKEAIKIELMPTVYKQIEVIHDEYNSMMQIQIKKII